MNMNFLFQTTSTLLMIQLMRIVYYRKKKLIFKLSLYIY
jgi:hypothetical protein